MPYNLADFIRMAGQGRQAGFTPEEMQMIANRRWGGQRRQQLPSAEPEVGYGMGFVPGPGPGQAPEYTANLQPQWEGIMPEQQQRRRRYLAQGGVMREAAQPQYGYGQTRPEFMPARRSLGDEHQTYYQRMADTRMMNTPNAAAQAFGGRPQGATRPPYPTSQGQALTRPQMSSWAQTTQPWGGRQAYVRRPTQWNTRNYRG